MEGKEGLRANKSHPQGSRHRRPATETETPTGSRSRRVPEEGSARGEIGAMCDNREPTEKRGKQESREGADARGLAATPRRTAPGVEPAPQLGGRRQPADPLQPGCSSHLAIRGNASATAGRRVCFQPCSLTWRPTSCHRARSSLPRHWRGSDTSSLPAPPPSAHPSRLAAGPRSIECEIAAREEVRRAGDHRVPARTHPESPLTGDWGRSLGGSGSE